MSNSSLVRYTRISPNQYGKRNHAIDRITPHCVVGQCSIETLGNIFAPRSRGASCNYGIGADGRVGMYVAEDCASWCSSNKANDERAVTIECASATTPPYTLNSSVYATLVILCVDICKRNGKNRLLWFGDKTKTLNYAPKSNEMVLTVHRWFANKSCPGDWLYVRLGSLASEVTKQLGGNAAAPAPSTPSAPSTSTGLVFQYEVRAGGKTYPIVKNLNSYAGARGKAITDIAIKVNKGSVKYRVHVKGGKWLPYVTGYNWKDANNGYAGNGKPIDAVQVILSGVSGQVAQYRVSPLNKDYYPWQFNANTGKGQDGYAGAFGKTIDRFQVY